MPIEESPLTVSPTYKLSFFQYLFAVNAGSNTVTMFSIDTADPTKLTMTGQPAAIPGDFPNAVTASAKNNLVCVGTTGAMAGISCGSFSARGGIGKMDALRPFDLNQTTPPMGPTDTVSQAFFSLDEGTLFTTVKGNPAVNTTGFLAAFPFSRACDGSAAVGRQGVMSSPAGTAVLFGSSTLAGPTDLFVTDASFGAVVLSVDSETDVAALVGKGTIAGQVATCWVAVSPASNTAFVADAGLDRLVEMSTGNASVLGEIDLSANGDPGLIDLAAAGKYVYALSPGNGTTQAAVTVVDVETKQQVQHFQLQAEGVGKNAQGMAVLL